jgi:hypothetical protein
MWLRHGTIFTARRDSRRGHIALSITHQASSKENPLQICSPLQLGESITICEASTYFSYGGVGVPAEYASLRMATAPIIGDYLKLVPAGDIELKHTEFKRIPYTEGRLWAGRISRMRSPFVSRRPAPQLQVPLVAAPAI